MMAQEQNGTIHLMGMRVENFCRIALAQIAPNGASVTIHGRNRQGKSSNTNALWVAMGGAEAMKELGITKPVREGEETAKIYVDAGDILIHRELNPDGSTKKLVVTDKDGTRQEPGQTTLDRFRGKFFDLSRFFAIEPEKRRELVLSLTNLGLDLKQWAAGRKAVFDERTIVNREVKALAAQLQAAPEVEAPDAEYSVDDILAEQAEAQRLLDDNTALRQTLQSKAAERDRCTERIAESKRRVEELRAQLVAEEQKLLGLEQSREAIVKEGKELQAKVLALKDPEMAAYSERISNVEKINQRVRAKKARAELAQRLATKEEEAAGLTRKLEAFDFKKETAIKEANFPVAGLGFDEDDITYNGIPFSQSSDMERLIVGYGIAKAVSPKFRVLRLSRPGDLDPENMAALLAMAEADGMQLLIEQVSSGTGGELVIEDGMIDAGTTEGVEKIMEITKPKRAKKAEGKADAEETPVIGEAELNGIYEQALADAETKGKGKGKAKTEKEAKPVPVAAPVEL